MTSGPYGLIFASFVPFFFDIPVSTRFRVVGVHFSDKSFIYLAGLQVISWCVLCNYLWCNTFTYSCSFLPQTLNSNFGFSLAASFIILEKINLTRDMWHPLWLLISSECLLYPQSKGYFWNKIFKGAILLCVQVLLSEINTMYIFFSTLYFNI